MTYLDVEVQGHAHKIAFEAEGEMLRVIVDGSEHIVDARNFDSFFYSLLIDGRSYEATVEENEEGFRVQLGSEVISVLRLDPLRPARTGQGLGKTGPLTIRAVMPGKVVRSLVAAGREVKAGEVLLVLEAMKMENDVLSPRDGKVGRMDVEVGATVEGGASLLVLE